MFKKIKTNQIMFDYIHTIQISFKNQNAQVQHTHKL